VARAALILRPQAYFERSNDVKTILKKRAAAAVGLAVLAVGVTACSGNVTGPLGSEGGGGGQLAAAPSSLAPEHGVTGAGRLVGPGVDAQISVSARLLADGTPTGGLTFNAHDLSGFGVPGHSITQVDVDCLVFEGNKVWFGGAIKHTTMPPPPGGGPHPPAIGVVVDSSAGDRVYFGPAPPGLTCHDRPFLPEFPIDGDFRVQ
jgi:hypothetical protein